MTRETRAYTRRDFGRIALASVPVAGLVVQPEALFGLQAKPNSTWGGVPFGIFAPYRFGPEASDFEGALKALVKFGVSNAELSAALVERYVGAPLPAPGGGGGGGRGRGEQTPEQQAAARAQAEAVRTWRTTVPMAKFAEARKKFNDAGVSIYAYRLTLNAAMSDAEYDYTFNAAKALGASQITMELPGDLAVSKRIGDAAAKHGVNVGYHLHTTASMTAWDEAMAQSPRNGIQLDIGHYVGGRSTSPVPFVEKHHARIFSMHLKDKTNGNRPSGGNVNQPWGQGDTPVKDVLQTLKKNKWAIPVGIEFEYTVPDGSTWDAEIAKCVQYGKDALTG
jgi:sugar phosphate isomerase/epimerase